jgi:uridine kinase
VFSPGAASAELVSDAIDAAKPEGLAVVVAIDGPSCAGKSTLTGELARLRGDVAIVEGDDFYRPLNESTRAALTPIEAVDLLFDWERLRDQVLAPLIRGEDAQYRRYDWTAERLGDDVATVAAQGVVVVEGCYVGRPALRGYYDLIVVVEAPRELCLARQVARGVDEPAQIERWRAAEDWYFERQHPKRVADLVIDASAGAE